MALPGCRRRNAVGTTSGSVIVGTVLSVVLHCAVSSAMEAPQRVVARHENSNSRVNRSLLRPQQLGQTMAFSRYRWSVLEAEKVSVFRTRNFERVAQFNVEDARNLVALTGGSFFVAGRQVAARLSPLSDRPRLFAAVPRLGITRIFPSPYLSEQLTLHYDGLSRLARVDLSRLGQHFLPVVGWTSLRSSDSHALLQLRDQSWVYTTEAGLYHQGLGQAEGRLIASHGFDDIWGLLRAPQNDEVWILDRHQASRVALRGPKAVRERFELPQRTVAVASSGARIATLSVVAVVGTVVQFRIDVRQLGTELRWSVFLDQLMSAQGTEAVADGFRPELRLSVRGSWVAVRGLSVEVHDYRKNQRVWPPQTPAGKLAQPER